METRLLCIALLAVSGVACVAHAAPNDSASLGINLGSVTYWSSEIVFVDLFKHAQTFKSQAPGKGYAQGGPLDLNADGYVRSLAAGGQFADSIVLSRPALGYPEGIYTCLYDGKGKIAFAYGVETVDEQPGRIRIRVKASQNLLTLRLTETDPSDPVRHIRVILPGFEETYEQQPFHPDFLKRWERFSTLRFMDFQRTNNSKQTDWTDRATPAFQTQGDDAGVALEYMIQLSDTLGADPWFCMPHRASDDYVRCFAQMVKARLDPGRKVYIEYSNECWNGIFEQARYCRDKGKELGLSDNEYQAQLRYYSKRSVEIFRIWEEVFGGTERLVRVLAAQSANPWTSEQVMDFEDAHEHADALGIAPYFGNALGDPKRQDEVARMSVDEILDRCAEFIAEGNETIAKQAELARERGLRLVAYEGGQHLVGYGGAENNEKLTELFHAANRHPRMRQLYLDYLAGWRQSGGTLMAVFSSMGTYSKWGSWGLLEYHGQDLAEAPKYEAVLEFLDANPKWW
ncbi:MAG TPA: hypothetical protein PLU87_06220 [Sedimentisphaerales bacterium]|nr:hypothetical protein [Sedimentisphaerales bacterium]HRS10318.1 hypothetical protein [Sedimentisphaerales bacterium]HRV47023.1 hypothetical protein [Sedimentisphaerales bacterium]